VYLLNINPTKAMQGITLEEARSWRKPHVTDLNFFYSIACIASNLEEVQSNKCKTLMFVGYSEHSKTHELLDIII